MYIKYESVDIEDYEKILEIAMFEGITYDYEYGCCRISFIGDYLDILQLMGESEYRELVFDIMNALSEKKTLIELKGSWILDFSDSFNSEEWENMFQKAKDILY